MCYSFDRASRIISGNAFWLLRLRNCEELNCIVSNELSNKSLDRNTLGKMLVITEAYFDEMYNESY